MLKRIIIVGWGVLIAGTALLLLFPRVVIHVLSPAVLLALSVVLILITTAYLFALVYRRI